MINKYLLIIILFIFASSISFSKTKRAWEEVYFGEFFEDLSLIMKDIKNNKNIKVKRIDKFFYAASIKFNKDKKGSYKFILTCEKVINKIDVWIRAKEYLTIEKGTRHRFVKNGDILIASELSSDGHRYIISGDYDSKNATKYAIGVFHTLDIPISKCSMRIIVDGKLVHTIYFTVQDI